MGKLSLALALLLTFALLLSRSPALSQNPDELRWEEMELRSGEVAEIVISPSDPNVMYAGFEVNTHSLYKSVDGGKNWTRINGGGDHTKDVAVSPTDPKKVYFAMSESLETTDLSFTSTARSLYGGGGPPGFRGETQVILSTGTPAGGSSVSFSSVEVFEGDDNIIYAARKGGPYGPFGGQGITPKIYKTTNRGRSWNEVEPKLSSINVLAVHPTNHSTILIGGDGVYISSDFGQSLNKLTDLSNTISIEYQTDNPNIIYAASSSKVLKTTDSGATWQDITGSLEDVHRVRVSRSNPNILYAATFNGVFRSDDGGNSWQDVSANLKAKNVQVVEISPINPDIAFVGNSSLWSSVRAEDRYRTGLLAHQGIYKTEDGGKTWTRSDNGIKEYQFEEVAVNPSKPHEAWILSPASRGGYKTEDGGYNWRLSQTPTFHYPMRVKYSFQDPDKVFASGWQNGAPFSISEDAGINWDFINEQVFFRGVNRGKSLYDDSRRGGAIHIHGIGVDPTDDKIVYAGSVHDAQNPVGFPLKGAHIFKSTDGGRSWTESDEGFPHDAQTAIHDIVVDPQNTDVVYVSTTEHESEVGVGVYKSTDAGKTWSAANNGLSGKAQSANTLLVHPANSNQLVLATFGGLYKSVDAGATWVRKQPANSFDVEYVIDDPNTVYASTGDGVLKSRDFGESWYAVNFGLPGGEGHGIGVDKTGNVIYAAVQDQGVYVARLTDIPAREPVSEFGKGYGFGEFFASGPGQLLAGGLSFGKILGVLVGLFIGIPLAFFIVSKLRSR